MVVDFSSFFKFFIDAFVVFNIIVYAGAIIVCVGVSVIFYLVALKKQKEKNFNAFTTALTALGFLEICIQFARVILVGVHLLLDELQMLLFYLILEVLLALLYVVVIVFFRKNTNKRLKEIKKSELQANEHAEQRKPVDKVVYAIYGIIYAIKVLFLMSPLFLNAAICMLIAPNAFFVY